MLADATAEARSEADASQEPERVPVNEEQRDERAERIYKEHLPKVALSKLINSLKGVSSRYLRTEYTGRINRIGLGSVFWSRSYFAGSCGGAPLSIVRQYIEGQKRPI